MLIRISSGMSGAVRLFIAALALLSGPAGCDSDQGPADCATKVADPKCASTLASHRGFELGMAKKDAFKNACELATQNRIWNPVFLVNGTLRAHPGVSMCALQMQAHASDQWSFIERAWLRERYIQLKFVDDKIESLRLLRRGWDP